MWANNLLPRTLATEPLHVRRQPVWWISAAILGAAYIWFLGRGIEFAH